MAGLPFGGKSGTPESNDSTANPPAPNTATTPQPNKRDEKKAKQSSKQQAKYGVFDPNELKKGRGLFGFLSTGGGKLTAASIVVAIAAGAGVYVYTVDNSATIEELFLNKDLPANTLVTAADVVPIQVSASSVVDPSLLVTQNEIALGTYYTKVALKPNTVLTLGSIGPYTRLSSELAPGMQLVSIQVAPENAAGGSIAAGDVIDIYMSGSESQGGVSMLKSIHVVDVIVAPKTIAQNATSDPATGQSSVGSDSPDLKSGIGSVYKLSVTPEQAAKIATAAGTNGGSGFYLALTDGTSVTPGEPTISVTPTTPQPVPSSDPFGAVTGATPSSGATPQPETPAVAPTLPSANPPTVPSGSPSGVAANG